MTAIIFGETERPLFGRLHRPAQRGRTGVVLCPPFGEEGIRSFRTFKVLAERLAQAGLATLRFDWFGTGDSSGECQDASLDRSVESLEFAHEELMDAAGVSKVIWIGLRLGANVALVSAATAPRSYAGMIAWNPIFDVGSYHQDLIQAHEMLVQSSLGIEARKGEALGFQIPEKVFDPLGACDAETALTDAKKKTILVANKNTGSPDFIDDPEPDCWNSDQAMNAQVVPTKTISMIVDQVTSW